MGATDPCSCTRAGCDRKWPRDPCLEVVCPRCEAAPGTLCKRPSGHTVWTQGKGLPKGIHQARHGAALEAGAYGSCPLGRCSEQPGGEKRQSGLSDFYP